MGEIHLEEGQLRQAAECFQKALSIYPNNASALAGLGLVHLRQEMPHEAEEYLRRAVSISSRIPLAYYFLGIISKERGELSTAIEMLRKSLELTPDTEIIYRDLCHAHFLAGDMENARAVVMQGIEHNPDFPEFHLILGNLNYFEQQPAQAAQSYRTALSLQPDASAYLNLGRINADQGDTNEAINCYQKALELNPNNPDIFYSLGSLLVLSHKDEAIAFFRNVLALQPGHLAALSKLIHLQMQQCKWDDLLPLVDQLHREFARSSVSNEAPPTPFDFLSLPGTTGIEQKHCAEMWAQQEYQPISALRKKLNLHFPQNTTGRITLGYLSADLQNHPVALLMARIFELHDRNRFHVIAYSYGRNDGSDMRKRLEGAFDKFVDISSMSNAEAATAINNDQIDILVDLTGYTRNSRTAILALRPAPVQVNYLGFAGTLGANFIDYIIGDEFVIPADSRQFYTEQVALLPNSFMPCDATRARPAAPSRTESGLPESGFVFCSFNNTYKITPEIFDVWCRLLHAVPGSVLWLSTSNSQVGDNLHQEARKRQIDPSRIIMASRVERIEDHLARLQLADLFLDTIPYNAHSTCSDALWMGVPLITCSGETFQSRVAGSMLRAIDLPELVIFSLEDYFALALELATTPERLTNIRQRLAHKRDSAPLFDSEGITRNLEQLYSEMHEDRLQQSHSGQTQQ